MTTITGRTTKSAVILEARDESGAVVAKGRTASRGYPYLVVRAARTLNPDTGERGAKVYVVKRTKDYSLAASTARNTTGGLVLTRRDDGTYA
jgi:hypothetical protein